MSARQRAGRQRRRQRRLAEGHGVDAFVFGDARQRLDDPRGVAGTNRIRDRLADGVRNQAGANVQIAHEPAHGEAVDERQHRVGECRQDDQQRDDEPEGKAHVSPVTYTMSPFLTA